MKLLSIFTASVLLSSATLAQTHLPIGGLPNNGGIAIPHTDPILVGIGKSKSYGATYGLSSANIQASINGYGTVFAVQHGGQVLSQATTGAKVQGVASVLGSALLGATATFDAQAANATWTYNGDAASVTNTAANAKATAFVKVGPWTLLNQTKSYSGDIVSAPSFVKNYTKHIFDVQATYPVVWPVDVTVKIGADAGAALTFSGTLDPVVANVAGVGSKAKMVGAADGWLSGTASVSFSAACFSVGLQVDLRLADSGFNGSVTADNNAVTGTVGLSEQPLAVVLKLIWSYCVSSGSYTIWNWGSSIYSANYAL